MQYEEPKIEIILFGKGDIATVSGEMGEGVGED